MTPKLIRRTLAALAAVLLLCLVLPALAAPGDDEKPLGKVPSDLALVSKDALWFMTIRAADLTDHAALKKVLPLLPGPDGPRGNFLKSMEKLTGIAPAAMERVTFVMRRMRGGPVTIIRTAKALDRAAVLKALGPTDENTFHGKKVFAPRAPRFEGRTLYHFADDHTVLVGWAPVIVPYLATLKAAGKTHALADELKTAAGKHSLVFAARPSLAYRTIDAEERGGRRWDEMPVKDRRFKDKERPFIKEKGVMPKEFRPKDRPKDFKGDPKKDSFKEVPKEKISGLKDAVVISHVVRERRQVDKDVKFKTGRLKEDRPFREKEKDGGRRFIEEVKEPELKLRTFDEITDDTEDRFRSVTLIPFLPAFRCRRVLITMDFGEEIKAAGKAEFESENDAKDGEVVGRMGLFLLREMLPRIFQMELGLNLKAPGIAAMVKQYKDAVRGIEVTRDGKTLTATGKAKIDFAPLLKHIAEEVPIRQDANNLKQIGLAFHNYHSAYNYFPSAAICDKDGKPLLSWRVAILPYIEEDALYRQFRLDEPWDSPHNKKLISKMPKIYTSPTGKAEEPDATFYQLLTGPNTLFPRPNDKPRIFNIRDGTSNTFLVVEGGKSVPWTKPEDVVIPAMGKLPKLGSQFPRFFHVVMADGSLKRIKRDADEEQLRRAIDPGDGHVVDFDKLKP